MFWYTLVHFGTVAQEAKRQILAQQVSKSEQSRSTDESQKGLERPPKRTQQTQNHGPAALAKDPLVCRHLRTHFNVLVRFCMQIVCK